jgi:hypothetical protein
MKLVFALVGTPRETFEWEFDEKTVDDVEELKRDLVERREDWVGTQVTAVKFTSVSERDGAERVWLDFCSVDDINQREFPVILCHGVSRMGNLSFKASNSTTSRNDSTADAANEQAYDHEQVMFEEKMRACAGMLQGDGELLRSVTSSPALQDMFQNPQKLQGVLENNPMFQAMLQKMPAKKATEEGTSCCASASCCAASSSGGNDTAGGDREQRSMAEKLQEVLSNPEKMAKIQALVQGGFQDHFSFGGS